MISSYRIACKNLNAANLLKWRHASSFHIPEGRNMKGPQIPLCECRSNNYYSVRNFTFTLARLSKTVPFKCPTFPESVTDGDITWNKNVGEQVEIDDVIGEIETDKTSIQVISAVSGTIEKLHFKSGDKVTQNCELGLIKETGSSRVESKPKVESPIDTKPEKIAREAEIKPEVKVETNTKPVLRPAEAATISGARTERRVKMSRIRSTIAQRLKDAQNTCAMLTTFSEIDMSSLMELRSKYQESFTKTHGTKLGFMSAFVSASCRALQEYPIVNAVIDKQDVLYRDYIDISVAVASLKGLVVPVIRNVQSSSFADIEKTIAKFGEMAKNNTLSVSDMEGGTFTISNGGIFGSLMGTPIINPPQSAILGMHSIVKRPVVVNDQITIRPMMYVALTYDHRIIDGREAVLFLRKIKDSIEDPSRLLLNI